jgi:hypothetical protein
MVGHVVVTGLALSPYSATCGIALRARGASAQLARHRQRPGFSRIIQLRCRLCIAPAALPCTSPTSTAAAAKRNRDLQRAYAESAREPAAECRGRQCRGAGSTRHPH